MKKTALPLTTISILLLAFFFSPACSGPRTGDEDKAGEPEKEVAVETQSTDHQPQSAKPVQTGKTINVYIENSGSMYGYVGVGGSDLRNTVYNYLTDVKLSKCFGSMGLNFVNSKVIPQGSAVDDFVKKLEPNTFKVAGGNHGTTDIAEIFKRVYPQQNNSTTVLVSDCIISPGKGHNAAEYLVNQQTGIKGFLGQKNLKNTGIIIYRMLGQFKGPYYNHVDEKKPYQGIRPYYIWVIGDIQQLKQMRTVVEPKMKTKPDEMCVISTISPDQKYNIVPGGGKYNISRQDRFTIEKLKKMKTAQGDRAVIKLSADYSKMLQDDAYLTDVSNYEVSDKSFTVDKIIKTNGSNYSITISSPVVKKGTVCVRLKNKLPQWVDKCSDTDGGFPDPNKKHQTTYGLAYLIGGVYDAYTFKGDNLAEMKITIK